MSRKHKNVTYRNTKSFTTEVEYDQKVPQDKISWHIKDLKAVSSLTEAQRMFFQSWFQTDQNIMAHGYPGTGKTFLSLYCALHDLLMKKYEKIYIVRSIVQTRNIGFTPGDIDEKIAPYLTPYAEVLHELLGRKSTLSNMIKKDLIEFIPTSFLRGRTLNGVIIFDECQNCTWEEAFTVLSRVGNDSRIIVSGDGMQCDLDGRREKGCMAELIKLCNDMTCIDTIPFFKEDCVRSGFVKELLESAVDLGLIE